ncbi:MAG: HD domain-containing protein [Chloroflexota bacterium]
MMLTTNERLAQQMAFIIEMDRLKNVLRRSPLADGSRRENTAEHSWHLAIMAMTLAEYANEPIDAAKAVRIVLVHDIVEIGAGDTFAYDAVGYEDKAEREQQAADELFGLLPEDQAAEFRSLWEEFEEGSTPEARFANAVDRLAPLMLNYLNGGQIYRGNGVSIEQIQQRMAPVAKGAAELDTVVEAMLTDMQSRGIIRSAAEMRE